MNPTTRNPEQEPPAYPGRPANRSPKSGEAYRLAKAVFELIRDASPMPGDTPAQAGTKAGISLIDLGEALGIDKTNLGRKIDSVRAELLESRSRWKIRTTTAVNPATGRKGLHFHLVPR